MTNLTESQRRRLLRHGFIFLFVGACLGIAASILPHGRAWRAAHVQSILTCLVLVAVGMVWRELNLTTRQRSIGLITGLTSAYAGLMSGLFTAAYDLPGPVSNPGVAPPMPQAAVFFALIAIIVPATLVSFGLVLYGMRGEPDR